MYPLTKHIRGHNMARGGLETAVWDLAARNEGVPLWKKIGGGCHLNRPIRSLIERAGFGILQLETGYVRGPKPLTFIYEGRATPAKT